MSLFGQKLRVMEGCFLINASNTKKVFPEETELIEFGLALMWNSNSVINQAKEDFETSPNLYANTNLFGRNRELLLNAYYSMLSSNYGTQTVVLRTVLENNNLMRLFNKEPRHAFEWLPKERQTKFSADVQNKYKGSAEKKEFGAGFVRNGIYDEKKESLKKSVGNIYGVLCDYTHPNFLGWQEIFGMQGTNEVLLELPTFSVYNARENVKIQLFMMQSSFKAFFDTFKLYLSDLFNELDTWQREFNRLIPKYIKIDKLP